ncbi:hypothetical protein TCAL_08183 [Tigriopus californicus]|uniref:Uncharacterized protein n=1 Tax=Tigriopus californicus TaxID=6832 RepID=A0A553P7E4_TIGCA|nr:uncharacterized protein LOC131878443 [Tigriopus californicus]XP_059080405.1 uncharacterized protein LOC131878443 [Tigriopus californicus]TRY73606.1 hypothetical protein TCAL_08183 [Tigriopus californicus]|eukprot:TCALIF_08183-PA protein Name:"Protein of unknown function" AED:0.00 eAED:0.00 QI:105/1/1/1/1/1/3/187/111
MTYWADNIKFIKDILDSKYKKIEDAIVDIDEHCARLAEDKDNKKAREGFLESARILELLDQKELETLAETMFKDMPEKERGEEEVHLKQITDKFNVNLAKIKEARAKYDIK